ncbi:MAG: alpha/beta hydrolase-fold protein [Mucilaginibacter sp.]
MNYRSNLTLLLPLVIFCSLFTSSKAQEVLPGKRDSINSPILKEKRIIQVVLPEKYKPGSADKYDVLYVLDGDWNTKVISEVQHFIESEAHMPPTIIVGILNIDRDKDLTPTHVAGMSTSGGADKFLGFLKNELIPYIDKTYPSNGDNTIFGHSFGGLFAMYALLNEPQVFKSYIAADPSFWWDHGYMDKVAKQKLSSIVGDRTLYITGREGEAYHGQGIDVMDTILKANAPSNLIWKSMGYPDETHGSVRLKSMYDGLKFTYAGFVTATVEFHPMNGTLLKDKPTLVWVVSDYSTVRYTTDGSEPTKASPRWGPALSLTAPAKLTAKSFSHRGRYDKFTTGEFKIGEVLPPLKKTDKFKPGGFHYAYYEGQFDKLPDFKKLKPVKEGIADSSFDINKLPVQNNFALLIEGAIEIKEDGYYVFGLDSDDGSRLYLGNQLLIDYDGLHGNGKARSYVLPLAKGLYPVRLEYFQKDGGRDLKLIYLLPGSKQPHAVPIPFNLQYSHK